MARPVLSGVLARGQAKAGREAEMALTEEAFCTHRTHITGHLPGPVPDTQDTAPKNSLPCLHGDGQQVEQTERNRGWSQRLGLGPGTFLSRAASATLVEKRKDRL